MEQGRPVAKYFSPIGKRFSCYEEVAAFFQRQNYSVPRHLFTFSVEEDLEGESSEESDLADFDSEPEDCESNCPSNAKRRRRVSSLWEEKPKASIVSHQSNSVQNESQSESYGYFPVSHCSKRTKKERTS